MFDENMLTVFSPRLEVNTRLVGSCTSTPATPLSPDTEWTYAPDRVSIMSTASLAVWAT